MYACIKTRNIIFPNYIGDLFRPFHGMGQTLRRFQRLCVQRSTVLPVIYGYSGPAVETPTANSCVT